MTLLTQAYGEVIWFDGRITPLVFSSFVLMVLSSVIAASPDLMPSLTASSLARRANDLAMYTGVPMGPTSGAAAVTPMAAAAPAPVATAGLSHNGYVWMLANCLVSATYVLVMRKRIKLTGFKDWDTMFFNNLLSIPVLLVMSLLVENWSAETFERNFPAERRSTLMFAIILSGTGGVFISYTTAWCIRVTSSTTYSMVGALNKLPLALSGILFFGNALTLYNSCGIAVGFIAGYVALSRQHPLCRGQEQAGRSCASRQLGRDGRERSKLTHDRGGRARLGSPGRNPDPPPRAPRLAL